MGVMFSESMDWTNPEVQAEIARLFSVRSFPRCGNCHSEESLAFDVDPYQADLFNDRTKMWLCDSCDYQSAMDI